MTGGVFDRLILVVDDDALVRASIARAVAHLGYPVIEAASGQQALERVASEPVGLVILDFVMPGMDGAETARRCAEIDPDLPILFSTGHAALRALRSATGEDIRVLEKPFSLEDLDALIREKLDERRRVKIEQDV